MASGRPRLWWAPKARAAAAFCLAGAVGGTGLYFTNLVYVRAGDEAARSAAAAQAADNLSNLLTQSATDRSSIVAAVADAQSCGSNLNQDPQILQNAATSRQNLLNELASLSGASNLPANLITNLKGAWQSSMEADKAYAQYAQHQISNGCVKNDTSDPNYQAAIGPDGHATTYKQAFVGLWNPIAMQYGLPTYVWYEL
jgi:hypothetical protein